MHQTVIVAHRGLSSLYPENTLLAAHEAIKAGAKAIEFDVQMTADKTPVLFHDPTLDRMSGRPGVIMQSRWQLLKNYSASYPERFGNQYANTRITTLREAVDLFKDNPDITPCIEIKRESIDHFGLKVFMEKIIQTTKSIMENAIILSFSTEAIDYLHSHGFTRTGWVLDDYSKASEKTAESLRPQILICDIKKLPGSDNKFWPGPWEWMVYQTEDPIVIKEYIDHGADYIETDNVKVVANSMPELFIK